jgi:hypothetical protein
MNPSKRARRFVLLSLLAGLLALLGCVADASAQSREGGGDAPPDELLATPPALPPPEIRPVTLADVTLIEDGAASPETLARFQVSTAAARQFARGYILEREILPAPFFECLTLPKVDAEGHVLGHFFLFSTEAECNDYAWLSAVAARAAERGREETSAEAPSSAWLYRAHQLTADRFFTITVAGYAFRPPLDLAHRGLPRFLLDPVELPETCPGSVEPDAIILAHDDTLHEAVSYPCSQGTLWYSHYARREMGADEALRPALAATLSTWKLNVIHSGDFAAEGLERLNRRWMFRIEAGRQNPDPSLGGGQ